MIWEVTCLCPGAGSAGSLLRSLPARNSDPRQGRTGQCLARRHRDRLLPLGQLSEHGHPFLLVFSSLDCLYTNTSHLEVNFRVDVIKPGKTLEVPIIFYPRESISYRELIPFEINGLSQQVVEIKGKGTEMKVRDNWGHPRAWRPPRPSQPPLPA